MLKVCIASDVFVTVFFDDLVELVLLDELVDDPLLPLDEELVEELEDPEELLAGVLAGGLVGAKVSFLGPNPTSEANVPPIASDSVLLLAVMTSSPRLLSDAVT